MTDAAERVSSGAPGLDVVLGGGFVRGGAYVVEGRPGAGKTILANQMCFRYARSGGRAVYLTLLSESHGRMIQNLRGFDFFEPSLVGQRLLYLSGYRALEQGAPALLDLIRRTLLETRAGVLVLDCVSGVLDLGSTLANKRFLHELQALLEAVGATALLITTADEPSPEKAIVDGILHLEQLVLGRRMLRQVQVLKHRGSRPLGGPHAFEIDENGLVVYPRRESLITREVAEVPSQRRFERFGVRGLDEMLGGGVLSGTTTMLLGAPGTGKTSLGLHFLHEGLKAGEPVLHLGFFEAPRRLVAQAERLGLSLREPSASGLFRLIWHPPLEGHLDQIGQALLGEVRSAGVRRVLIDGLPGLQMLAANPERLSGYLAAITAELRALDATTVVTAETPTVFGPSIDSPVTGMSALCENAVLLRFVEVRSRLHRLAAVLKVRENAHDTALRELEITSAGVRVSESFASAEALLAGSARVTGPPPAAPGTGEDGA